ncbi:MAG: hypothetical protein R6U94_11385 [Nitriliruptoraceae bacterium]
MGVVKIRLWDAHQLNKKTQRQLSTNQRKLEHQRERTKNALEDLGRTKLEVYDGAVRRFATVFERLKNVELNDLDLEQLPEEVEDYNIKVRGIDFGPVDAMKTTVLSGGAGAAAGLITWAGVGTVGAASTGTAISTLGGAAATNATLAWLGGGSLAAGGMGMAGGMAVLGGLVAAPVLAVGGLVVHHKGKQAYAQAKHDAAEAQKAVAEMDLAISKAEQIQVRALDVRDLVERLAALAGERIAVLEYITAAETDYKRFPEVDKQAVRVSVMLVKTLRAVMDVPLITEQGDLSGDGAELLGAARKVLRDQRGRQEEKDPE